MNFGVLETILCVLVAALVISVLFRRFQLPVVLGYFTVGLLMGPNALQLIPDTHSINEIAEFGIVFLMFTVGLEFSQAKLFTLKKSVFLTGGLQVLLTIIITTGVGYLIGMTFLSALVMGGIVAMSSTALVVKQLNDQSELHTNHGLNAIGILLFQDLAVIPFIILIVGLSTPGTTPLPMIFLWALIKGVFAIALITVLGRRLLKPIFNLIIKTRAVELFTITVLLVTLTAAWITNSLGLSYAFGAFLAGIMLSETEFRYQIEIEIRPFRDILLGLFFISVGMLANMHEWDDFWEWITLAVFAITICKLLLIALISRLTGNSLFVSFRTGLILAQGGEFGFAILALAIDRNMLSMEYGQVILAALLISIAMSPILIRFNYKITKFLLRKNTRRAVESQQLFHDVKDTAGHVLICGFGRVGQSIACLLEKLHYPYIGLDVSADIVRKARAQGRNVMFGDASHPGILHAAGIAGAKALLVSFDKMRPTIRVLSVIRKEYPALPIIVRCKDEAEIRELKKYGATKIVAEVFEESLVLSQHLLHAMDVPSDNIFNVIENARKDGYLFLSALQLRE